MSIKIAITDDHPMIVDGIQNLFSNYNHITLTGTYSDGIELMKGLESNVPDILLLDIQLPGQTGDELVPILLKKYPHLRILVLTTFNNIVYANNMLRQGVAGYLLKTARQHTMMEAIETVFNGNIFIEPSLKEKLEGEISQKTRSAVYSKIMLTLREKEILKLIIKGHTNQEIISSLFLSINTVKNYRKRIYRKLDAKNMAELTKKAIDLNLTE